MTKTITIAAFALFSTVACGGRYEVPADSNTQDRAIIVDAGDSADADASPVEPVKCELISDSGDRRHGREDLIIRQTGGGAEVGGCTALGAGFFSCPADWCTYTQGTCPGCFGGGE
jgi:hypothetical protein